MNSIVRRRKCYTQTDWTYAPTNPTTWGLPDEDVICAWEDRERDQGVMRQHPTVQAMAEELGPEWLFLLARQRQRQGSQRMKCL